MTAHFPSKLRPTPGDTGADRQANRRALRNLLREHGKLLLEKAGYKIGDSLGLDRGRAFNAQRDGKAVKIGIRASSDRWIAATKSALADGGELTEVDELVVVAFTDPKVKDAIEVYRFDASVVAEAATKVFAASGKTGQQWVPLDDTKAEGVHSMAGGSLAKQGEVIASESVVWVDGEMLQAADAASSEANGSGAPLKLTIEQAKAGLAAQFGVGKEAIRITIEG